VSYESHILTNFKRDHALLNGQRVAFNDLSGVAAKNFSPALLQLYLHVELLFVIKKVY
jgi:hypothetical protein